MAPAARPEKQASVTWKRLTNPNWLALILQLFVLAATVLAGAFSGVLQAKRDLESHGEAIARMEDRHRREGDLAARVAALDAQIGEFKKRIDQVRADYPRVADAVPFTARERKQIADTISTVASLLQHIDAMKANDRMHDEKFKVLQRAIEDMLRGR